MSILVALPFLVISGEITGDGTFDISSTIKAIAAVTITKAWSASKVIACIYQEMTGLANVAFFSFYILFAGANASLLVALGIVVNASLGFAFTTITASVVEVPIVGSALVTLFASHTWLTFAFSIGSTL